MGNLLKVMEEVICRINPANSDIFAGLIWQIMTYLPDQSGKQLLVCQINPAYSGLFAGFYLFENGKPDETYFV